MRIAHEWAPTSEPNPTPHPKPPQPPSPARTPRAVGPTHTSLGRTGSPASLLVGAGRPRKKPRPQDATALPKAGVERKARND
jgi:hypothetical protein